MADPKNPLGPLTAAASGAIRHPIGTATGVIRHPIGTAGKVVGTALGTAAAGRSAVGHLGRAVVGKAVGTAGAVVSRSTGHGSTPPSPRTPSAPSTPTSAPEPVSRPAGPQAVPAPINGAGDAVQAAARKTAAKKAPAKTAPTKTAPTKTAPTKTAAKKAPAKKAPAKKTAAKETSDMPTPADVAEVVAKKAAPATARQVADVEERPAVTTPVGTTGADVATNPDTTDTDLQQPGTAPLLDPGMAKSLRTEAATMRRAAETGDELAAEDS